MERLERLSTASYQQLRDLVDLEAEKFRLELIRSDMRFDDPKKLNRHERSIYSQCGEDGIIAEIFRRIGVTNSYFIEFGAGNGLQNSTTALLLKNWIGLWMETAPENVNVITSKFSSMIIRHQLTFRQVFVTAENIEATFEEASVPKEFDLLSIDIDGNDYWVWNAINKYRPRVVICEYNGRFGPDIQWIMKYNPEHCWTGGSYYGASLKSLEILAKQKGYRLAGCNLSGVNAFFIREDVMGNHFSNDATSENHFEPQRHFLIRDPSQPNDFGPFNI